MKVWSWFYYVLSFFGQKAVLRAKIVHLQLLIKHDHHGLIMIFRDSRVLGCFTSTSPVSNLSIEMTELEGQVAFLNEMAVHHKEKKKCCYHQEFGFCGKVGTFASSFRAFR